MRAEYKYDRVLILNDLIPTVMLLGNLGKEDIQ